MEVLLCSAHVELTGKIGMAVLGEDFGCFSSLKVLLRFGHVELAGKMGMAAFGRNLGVTERFSSLKVPPPVRPSTSRVPGNWMAPAPGLDVPKSQALVLEQPQFQAPPATTPTPQPAKPLSERTPAASPWEAPEEKDPAGARAELGELQKSLLHPPFSAAPAQERAHPNPALPRSVGEL